MNILLRWFCFFIFILLGCNNEKVSKDIIVSVYDEILYNSDLIEECTPFLSHDDSILKVQIYIDKWITDKLILNQAKINLHSNNLIDKQVNEYRNQLLKYNYQKNMIAEKMDTVVTFEEVNLFYNENKNKFILKENILKLRYAFIDVNAPDLSNFESNFINLNNFDNLNKYCLRNSREYYFNDSIWISLNNLCYKFNLSKNQINNKINKLHKIQIDNFYFYYFIVDFIDELEYSPIDYCEVKIIDAVLRDRIKLFLNKLEDNIFETELSNGNIIYY